MCQSIGTVYYDDQFWVFLVETIDEFGVLKIGKYTFGAEPSNTDLISFYLNTYAGISKIESTVRIRTIKSRKEKEQERITKKSKEVYNVLKKQYCVEQKKERKKIEKLDEEKKYYIRIKKKKDNRKGH